MRRNLLTLVLFFVSCFTLFSREVDRRNYGHFSFTLNYEIDSMFETSLKEIAERTTLYSIEFGFDVDNKVGTDYEFLLVSEKKDEVDAIFFKLIEGCDKLVKEKGIKQVDKKEVSQLYMKSMYKLLSGYFGEPDAVEGYTRYRYVWVSLYERDAKTADYENLKMILYVNEKDNEYSVTYLFHTTNYDTVYELRFKNKEEAYKNFEVDKYSFVAHWSSLFRKLIEDGRTSFTKDEAATICGDFFMPLHNGFECVEHKDPKTDPSVKVETKVFNVWFTEE